MRLLLPCFAVFLASSLLVSGQDAKFPLESISLEGTIVSQPVVLEMAGLKIGTPINKASIEETCRNLGDSGIFETINYRYGPGPKGGYQVTLTLDDPRTLAAASIDIPGVDDQEVWKWLVNRFPAFNHKVPEPEAAQKFLAHQIELHLADEHLSDRLRGQHLVVRIETDFAGGRGSLLSFQPETLPPVASLSFTGQHEIPADELTAILKKAMGDQGYLDRRFHSLVELNLRTAYEARGMYRVKFPSIAVQPAGEGGVSVAMTIEEGPQYTLGNVQVVGNDLPVDAMLAAAALKKGKIANWTEIQNGLWAMERPIKRTGYMNASTIPNRVFDDERHILALKVEVNKGPLYRFGQVQFLGLSPELNDKAYKIWQMQQGQPYDFAYSDEFLKAFAKAADLRKFKKITPSPHAGIGDHVIDLTLMFQPQ